MTTKIRETAAADTSTSGSCALHADSANRMPTSVVGCGKRRKDRVDQGREGGVCYREAWVHVLCLAHDTDTRLGGGTQRGEVDPARPRRWEEGDAVSAGGLEAGRQRGKTADRGEKACADKKKETRASSRCHSQWRLPNEINSAGISHASIRSLRVRAGHVA
jgi:hypothetical protein